MTIYIFNINHAVFILWDLHTFIEQSQKDDGVNTRRCIATLFSTLVS